MNIPKEWTTIAIFSLMEGKYFDCPGAIIKPEHLIDLNNFDHRQITVSGRKFMQVRAK